MSELLFLFVNVQRKVLRFFYCNLSHFYKKKIYIYLGYTKTSEKKPIKIVYKPPPTQNIPPLTPTYLYPHIKGVHPPQPIKNIPPIPPITPIHL